MNQFVFLFEKVSKFHGWNDALSANPLLAKGARLCAAIEELGGEAFIVGGVVRDLLLGKGIHDVDIATNTPIEDLSGHFKTFGVGRGEEFGITNVEWEGESFEVANYRSEQGYSDSRRPDSVTREQSFEKDAERRDFTINSMGIDKDGNITDYFGGITDIENKILRTVGNASERFSEDALRLLRAARFAARLGFDIDPDTKDAMDQLSNTVTSVSGERIKDELIKSASDGNTLANFIEHLDTSGMLNEILPELKRLQGMEHNPSHHPEGDVWEHVISCIRHSHSNDPVTNLAILFHDLERGVHYYGHEKEGLAVFDQIAVRLKFKNSDSAKIKFAIENHMHGHKLGDLSAKKVLALRQDPNWDTLKHVVSSDERVRLHLYNHDQFLSKMQRADDIYNNAGDKVAMEKRLAAFVDGRRIMTLRPDVSGVGIGAIKDAVRDFIISQDFNVTQEEVDKLILSL